MNITKALITAAGPKQRKLPLQTLIDMDGIEKSVLEILIEEIKDAGINEIGIIIHPNDKETYSTVIGQHIHQVEFIEQHDPRGYGHAILLASDFIQQNRFLHLVGDHLYVKQHGKSCAQQLIETAQAQECSVSAVQSTRESQIPYFGVVGGTRIQGSKDVYKINSVIEKPTPTEAEQKLLVPGLRAGHYLCFFGMHVLSPTIFQILEKNLNESNGPINLSSALDELAKKEQYLAIEKNDLRFDVGSKYGLMKAQIALALNGKDRDMVLSDLLEFFSMRELHKTGGLR
ncbi:MAG: hypothetical protein MI922_16790 [Bacteroidales bacterium]|nr:hypothetical protein [Bacteroidales bacterium]